MKKSLIAILFVLSIVPTISLAQNTNTPGIDCGPTNSSLCNPIQANNGGISDLRSFVEYAMAFIGGLLGLMAICTLVYAGVRMVIANGNDKTITEAKNTILYSLIGFAASILAYVGVLAVEHLIGVTTTTPAQPNGPFNPFGPGVTLQNFVQTILVNVIRLSGLIALLMIIVYGFRYMTARGDDKQVSSAKTGLLWSVIGIVIILFSYIIVVAVINLLRN